MSGIEIHTSDERGIGVESSVSKLLENLDYVTSVRGTKKNGPEDKQKIDLVVNLDKSKKDLSISEVLVQVKASTTRVISFKREVRQILNNLSEENVSCEEWLMRNRMIILVGDVRISRSRKSKWPVSSEEIIDSFESQLQKIDNYQRS
ncbi:MAG: hypothetical protein PHR98_02885 [Candidatus Shapirobacteria bacterium]|nr:hypothetical protein [Candidatus Shapirobacteria bacterium]